MLSALIYDNLNLSEATTNQGKKANLEGKKFETVIKEFLDDEGIAYVKEQPFTSIYNHKARMDFYLTDFDLAIEAKHQNVAGTVDEKIPYVMHNLESHPASRGVLVLNGDHWDTKPGIYHWAKQFAEASSKQIDIIFYHELRGYLEQTKTGCAA